MIKIEMTIREAIAMASSSVCNGDMYERIVKAIEISCGESNINVTLRSMKPDALIPCIKALRLATGWGLKESKDFCDVVRGKSAGYDNGFYGGAPNTLILNANAGRKLAEEWEKLGCDVVTDYFNC